MGRHTAVQVRRAGTASRRLRAVLAGGLVLGVGAAVTLAAWNDSEYATGSFSASVFNTESSIDRDTWAHNTNPPVATFTAVSGMSPTVSAYSSFNIRTTSATNVAGTVSLTNLARTTTAGSLTEVLEYRIARLATATTACNATTIAAGTWVAGGASSYVAATAAVPAPVSSALAAGGGEVRFCIDVRIAAGAANSYQGATGTLTWTFTATSNN